jgi:hypothetical protein
MHQIDEKANLRLVNFLFLGNLIFFHPPLIFAFNTEIPSPSHPTDPSQQHEDINEDHSKPVIKSVHPGNLQ